MPDFFEDAITSLQSRVGKKEEPLLPDQNADILDKMAFYGDRARRDIEYRNRQVTSAIARKKQASMSSMADAIPFGTELLSAEQAVQRGTLGLMAPLVRPFDPEAADAVQRYRSALTEAQQAELQKRKQEEKIGTAREWLNRVGTGAGESLFQAATLAPLGGASVAGRTAAMATGFAATSADNAYADAKRRGASETTARQHALWQGGLEGGIMAGFSAAGLGGVESMFAGGAKEATKTLSKEFLKSIPKSVLKTATPELVEEVSTTIAQSIAEAAVLPGAEDVANWTGRDGKFTSSPMFGAVVDTVGQTLLTLGMAGGGRTAFRAASEMLAQDSVSDPVESFKANPSRSNAKKLPDEVKKTLFDDQGLNFKKAEDRAKVQQQLTTVPPQEADVPAEAIHPEIPAEVEQEQIPVAEVQPPIEPTPVMEAPQPPPSEPLPVEPTPAPNSVSEAEQMFAELMQSSAVEPVTEVPPAPEPDDVSEAERLIAEMQAAEPASRPFELSMPIDAGLQESPPSDVVSTPIDDAAVPAPSQPPIEAVEPTPAAPPVAVPEASAAVPEASAAVPEAPEAVDDTGLRALVDNPKTRSDDLRKLLKQRGLKTGGSKATRAQRLREYLSAKEDVDKIKEVAEQQLQAELVRRDAEESQSVEQQVAPEPAETASTVEPAASDRPAIQEQPDEPLLSDAQRNMQWLDKGGHTQAELSAMAAKLDLPKFDKQGVDKIESSIRQHLQGVLDKEEGKQDVEETTDGLSDDALKATVEALASHPELYEVIYDERYDEYAGQVQKLIYDKYVSVGKPLDEITPGWIVKAAKNFAKAEKTKQKEQGEAFSTLGESVTVEDRDADRPEEKAAQRIDADKLAKEAERQAEQKAADIKAEFDAVRELFRGKDKRATKEKALKAIGWEKPKGLARRNDALYEQAEKYFAEHNQPPIQEAESEAPQTEAAPAVKREEPTAAKEAFQLDSTPEPPKPVSPIPENVDPGKQTALFDNPKDELPGQGLMFGTDLEMTEEERHRAAEPMINRPGRKPAILGQIKKRQAAGAPVWDPRIGLYREVSNLSYYSDRSPAELRQIADKHGWLRDRESTRASLPFSVPSARSLRLGVSNEQIDDLGRRAAEAAETPEQMQSVFNAAIATWRSLYRDNGIKAIGEAWGRVRKLLSKQGITATSFEGEDYSSKKRKKLFDPIQFVTEAVDDGDASVLGLKNVETSSEVWEKLREAFEWTPGFAPQQLIDVAVKGGALEGDVDLDPANDAPFSLRPVADNEAIADEAIEKGATDFVDFMEYVSSKIGREGVAANREAWDAAWDNRVGGRDVYRIGESDERFTGEFEDDVAKLEEQAKAISPEAESLLDLMLETADSPGDLESTALRLWDAGYLKSPVGDPKKWDRWDDFEHWDHFAYIRSGIGDAPRWSNAKETPGEAEDEVEASEWAKVFEERRRQSAAKPEEDAGPNQAEKRLEATIEELEGGEELYEELLNWDEDISDDAADHILRLMADGDLVAPESGTVWIELERAIEAYYDTKESEPDGPKEQRSLFSLKNADGSKITPKDIIRAFPGATVKPSGTGYRVFIGESFLDLETPKEIPFTQADVDAMEKSHGKKLSADILKTHKAAGRFQMRMGDGTIHGGLGLIRISQHGDAKTVAHEALHLAFHNGMLTEQRKQALVKRYAPDAKTPAAAEEAIAQAYEKREVSNIIKRAASWVRRFLSETLGITELQARDVFIAMEAAGFWKKAKGRTSSGKSPKRSDRTRKELDAAVAKMKRAAGRSFQNIDPTLLKEFVNVTYAAMKHGSTKFAEYVQYLAKEIGAPQLRKHAKFFEDLFSTLSADPKTAFEGSSGKVADVIGETESTAAEEIPKGRVDPDVPIDDLKKPLSSGDDLTGVKREKIDQYREQRGLQGIGSLRSGSVAEWEAAAKAEEAADPNWAKNLVTDLGETKRIATSVEVIGLDREYVRLQNAFKREAAKQIKAQEEGRTEDVVIHGRILDDLNEELGTFEGNVAASLTQWSATGNAAQRVIASDYSLEGAVRNAHRRKGAPLTTEQRKEIEEYAEEIVKLRKKIDALEEKLQKEQEEKAARAAAEAQIAKDAREAAKRKRAAERKKKTGAKRSAARKRADEALAKWKKKFDELKSGRAPQSIGAFMLNESVEVVNAYVKLGAATFSDFMASIRADMGVEVDDAEFREAWDFVHKPDTSDVSMDNPNSVTRIARQIQTQILAEATADPSFNYAKKTSAEKHAYTEEVLNEVHRQLKEIEALKDITRNEVMNALSKYGVFRLPSKEEIDILTRDQRRQWLQIGKQESYKKNEKAKRTGQQRDEPSDEERYQKRIADDEKRKYEDRLRAQGVDPSEKTAAQLKSIEGAKIRALENLIRDLENAVESGKPIVRNKSTDTPSPRRVELKKMLEEARKLYAETFPKEPKGRTDEQRRQDTLRAIEKVIELRKKQIGEGDLFNKPLPEKLSSPEIENARAELAKLNAEREALRAASPEYQEHQDKQWLMRRMAAIQARRARYTEQIAKNDFGPKEVRERPSTPELRKLELAAEKEKRKVNEAGERWRRERYNSVEKAADIIAETINLSRGLRTTLDLPPMFRQAGAFTFGHPVLAAKGMIPAVHAIGSEQAEFDIRKAIEESPNHQSGLHAKAGLEVDVMEEEETQGRWVKRAPVLKHVERGYRSYLNLVRQVWFDNLVATLSRDGEVSIEEAKTIADFVNNATGRGSFGKGEWKPSKDWNNYLAASAKLLSMAYFSARYTLSRFRYALGAALSPTGHLSRNKARRLIAREYARTLAGVVTVMSAIYQAAAMFMDPDDEEFPTIEKDTRSSDGWKLKIGEQRIDLMFGVQQPVVFLSRFITGQTKLGNGEVVSLDDLVIAGEKQSRGTVLRRFNRSKSSPMLGAIQDLSYGEDVVGNEVTTTSAALSLVVPLIAEDIADNMVAEYGITRQAASALVAALGAGAQTYGPKTQYLKSDQPKRLELVGDTAYKGTVAPGRKGDKRYDAKQRQITAARKMIQFYKQHDVKYADAERELLRKHLTSSTPMRDRKSIDGLTRRYINQLPATATNDEVVEHLLERRWRPTAESLGKESFDSWDSRRQRFRGLWKSAGTP